MKTIKDIIQLSAEYLEKAGIESSRVDAEWLIADALDLKRMDLYLQFDRPLDEEQLAPIRARVGRRAKHEPVQYIIGNDEFYGLEFEVGPGVLVPRPETEILVDRALAMLKPDNSVLDLCTGSACIAVALKKTRSDLDVFATDLSSDALGYAQKNVQNNEVDVKVLQGDLFESVLGMTFDGICTNPPYVAETEVSEMGKDVVKHEPHLALFSGVDGLDIIRKIASEGRAFLNPGGFIITEMGPTQGKPAVEIFRNEGWSNPEIIQDYSKRDRFVLAFNQP
ncbi:MAG: peptide chain release factor N(5)-glutamine methyltransferase [Lentisphaeraceae bacterium]|nr:peptide chain release factor N(5)-glutamine methyltransferase [Lentisphaeraceae bacterium]